MDMDTELQVSEMKIREQGRVKIEPRVFDSLKWDLNRNLQQEFTGVRAEIQSQFLPHGHFDTS